MCLGTDSQESLQSMITEQRLADHLEKWGSLTSMDPYMSVSTAPNFSTVNKTWMYICTCVSPVLPEGGMKEIALHTNRQYMGGLVGCVSHFTLSTDYHLALVEDAADGKNINTCST